MKVTKQKNIAFGLLIASITLLPGCTLLDWFQGKSETNNKVVSSKSDQGFDVVEDSSAVIVTMEGQPIVSKASLEKEYQQLLQDNPQIAQMLPLMGGKDQLMQRLVSALVERQIVKRYIAENNIDTSIAYQNELDRMIKSVKDMLNVKYFNQQHPVTVTDSEVKKFYEDNKETMPELLVSRGGIRAMGVKFNEEEKAKQFLNQVNAQKGNISKVAETDKVNLQDFKLVNAQSVGISPELRDKISALQQVPSTNLFKINDKTYWVVRATAKEQPAYHEYDKVKDQLKKYLEDQEREKMLRDVMDNLKNKYNVDVKQDAMPAPTPAPKAKKMAEAEQSITEQETSVAQADNKAEQAPVQQATQTV